MPLPARISRPATRLPATATTAAARTRPVSTAALAVSIVQRRGVAVSVTRIMPVLYSPLITSTASTATTAWPTSIPVRLTLVGSTAHPAPPPHLVTAAVAAPTATVSTHMAARTAMFMGSVRSLVHSARTVLITRPSVAATTSPGRKRRAHMHTAPPPPPTVLAGR